MTTPTPLGSSRSMRKSATCWVMRSWTWSRRAVHLDDARDLGQPDDPAARDVRDRGGAEERQQMVLAQRRERDVPDDHHLAVIDLEDGAVDEPVRDRRGSPRSVRRTSAGRAPACGRGPVGPDPRRSPAGCAGRRPRPGHSRQGRVPSPSMVDDARPGSSPISVSISSTIRRTWGGSASVVKGLSVRWAPMVRPNSRFAPARLGAMAHPRVDQLRFARSEFKRGLRGLDPEDAVRRLEPMNSIPWMVGHLAWHDAWSGPSGARACRSSPT